MSIDVCVYPLFSFEITKKSNAYLAHVGDMSAIKVRMPYKGSNKKYRKPSRA